MVRHTYPTMNNPSIQAAGPIAIRDSVNITSLALSKRQRQLVLE